MNDERAARRRRPAVTDDDRVPAEQSEALARAAREAVRQPADPRIERSFAHLGVVPKERPAPDPMARPTAPGAARAAAAAAPTRAVPSPAPTTSPASSDVRSLLDAVAAWQRSTDDLRRRLDVVTWLLAGLTVVISLLAIVLILRGPG